MVFEINSMSNTIELVRGEAERYLFLYELQRSFTEKFSLK